VAGWLARGDTARKPSFSLLAWVSEIGVFSCHSDLGDDQIAGEALNDAFNFSVLVSRNDEELVARCAHMFILGLRQRDSVDAAATRALAEKLLLSPA
jgi:hypothetical protein